MWLWNPFKRANYTFRTTLALEECGRRVTQCMSDYNTTARSRCLITMVDGPRFTARLEPLSFGPIHDGAVMRHFVVEARGTVLPMRDGTVSVTVALQRSISLFQILWRFVLLSVLVAVAGSWFSGGFRLGTYATVGPISALLVGPPVFLWSLIAYVQGLRQASRDWTALLTFLRRALASHADTAP